MQKYQHRPASRILDIRDRLTAIMADDAILSFGIWIENKLDETDGEGNRIYSLEELLADELVFDNEAAITRLEAMPGFVRRRKAKTASQGGTTSAVSVAAESE